MARRRNAGDETAPLLAEEGILPSAEKARSKKNVWRHKSGEEWDPDLPYGGKVYLARKLMDDPLWVKVAEVRVGCFRQL